MKAEITEASNNPSSLLVEAIHSVGYSGALANSLLASESAIGRLDSSILEEFVAVSWRKLCIAILHYHYFCTDYNQSQSLHHDYSFGGISGRELDEILHYNLILC